MVNIRHVRMRVPEFTVYMHMRMFFNNSLNGKDTKNKTFGISLKSRNEIITPAKGAAPKNALVLEAPILRIARINSTILNP